MEANWNIRWEGYDKELKSPWLKGEWPRAGWPVSNQCRKTAVRSWAAAQEVGIFVLQRKVKMKQKSSDLIKVPNLVKRVQFEVIVERQLKSSCKQLGGHTQAKFGYNAIRSGLLDLQNYCQLTAQFCYFINLLKIWLNFLNSTYRTAFLPEAFLTEIQRECVVKWC